MRERATEGYDEALEWCISCLFFNYFLLNPYSIHSYQRAKKKSKVTEETANEVALLYMQRGYMHFKSNNYDKTARDFRTSLLFLRIS